MTEADKTRQELNEKQQLAIDLIMSGMRDQEIADACGVTRQTVNEWRNHDQAFILALFATREELHESHYRKLCNLTNDAITIIQQSLQDQNPKIRFAAAVQVLKAQGMYGHVWHPDSLSALQNRHLLEVAREYFKEQRRKKASLSSKQQFA